MPYAAPSLCTKGCGTLVYGGGQCPTCLTETRRERDKKRPNGYQRGYTREWAAFSKDYLTRHPWCECDACLNTPHNRPRATDVDHRDGTGRNGPRAYDESNLIALSHGHHSAKTVRHDGGFGRPNAQERR